MSYWPGLVFWRGISFFYTLCTNKQGNIDCIGLKNTFFKGKLCSKELGGWVYKIAIFADVQYFKLLGQKKSKIMLT